ncbi:MAG: hypothetical protein ACFB6S_06460 [Geminicoccaceae bacterium]
MIAAFPLLVLVIGAYNLAAFAGADAFDGSLMSIALLSGAVWEVSLGDLLIAVGLVLLYFEIFKATRTSTASIVDHVLSLVVFVVALLEFLVLPAFGTSAFFILLLMTLIDVIAGFTVTISTARRDIGLERGIN